MTAVFATRRAAGFAAFTNKLIPGRWDEVRQPSHKELKATTILAMSIEEAVTLMNREDEKAVRAVGRIGKEISRAIELVVAAFEQAPAGRV